MKLFKQVQPEDAEVLRQGKWICYDAKSVTVGDIVRVSEGDTVPADCILLSLGMEHTSEDVVPESPYKANDGENIGLTVDHNLVTGEEDLRTFSKRSDGTVPEGRILCGGKVTQGSGIAVVVAVGNKTVLGILIEQGKWPVSQDMSEELDVQLPLEVIEGEDQSTVALIKNEIM